MYGDTRPLCLNIFFMKFLDPADHVLLPVMISVRADSARLLQEMALELGTTLDELISALAEDSAYDLENPRRSLDDVFIPDQCSKDDLLKMLE